MIKVSIKHHNPIVIYEFLQEHAGPVKRMMVKQGHAIISFKEEKDYKMALERFEYFSLCGKGVSLEPYSQENKNESEMVNEANERGKELIKHEMEKGISDFLEKMEENDTLDNIEKLVKKHKNSMAQQMAIVDNFMKEAQQKVKNYVQSFGENNQKIKKIENHLQKRLKTIFKSLKSSYNFLKNQIKTFDQTQINLEPEFQCSKMQQKPLNITFFKQHLQYLNLEPSGCIKRLSPFNNSQFIFSEMSRKSQNFQGRLKIYDLEQLSKKTGITCKEGAYGLLVVDKYIITGTFCGYFSYYHQDRTDLQELTPRLFGTYGTPQKITDILFGGERYRGYNIFALGQRKTVKSFYVQQCEMCPNIKSLIFSERHTICQKNGKQIGAIEMLQSTQELLMASSNILSVYDLNNQTYSNQINTVFDILRIKRFDQRFTYLAQRKRMSLVDIRSSQIKRFTFKADVSALCVLNEHSVIYGTERGQIGLFDARKQNIVFSDTLVHKDWISDIIKINDTIVSGDREGQIVSWKGM